MSAAVTLPRQLAIEQITAQGLELTVNSPQTEAKARAYLSDVDAALKHLKADAENLKRPHQDFVNEVNAKVKPLEALLKERRATVAGKIIAYQEFCEAEARKKQAAELAKWEKKVERLERKAEVTGAPVPIVPPPPLIMSPPKTVETEAGTQTMRVTKDWRLPTVVVDGQAVPLDKDALTYQDALDYKLSIPAAYFFFHPGKVGQIVRAGGHVPGIEVFEVKNIAVKNVG